MTVDRQNVPQVCIATVGAEQLASRDRFPSTPDSLSCKNNAAPGAAMPGAVDVETTMEIPRFSKIVVVLVSLSATGSVPGEVVDAAAGGFTTRYSVDINATREQVYTALVTGVGQWWSDDHTVSGSAKNLYIDARALGCFCEKLGEGAGLTHMTVTFANPGVMLRLTGGLGPLGLMGVAGNMTFDINETDGVSTVVLQYAVGGYLADGLDKLASPVDGVLVDVLNRLKEFVEVDDK